MIKKSIGEEDWPQKIVSNCFLVLFEIFWILLGNNPIDF